MPIKNEAQPATTIASTQHIPMRNPDGTILLNTYGETVYQAQFINSHPLRRDCKERVGPNGLKLTYVTGHGVIRDLNLAFGHGNWSTELTREKEIGSSLDDDGRWNVGYLATVKLTLLSTGASHEDVGSGEATNENKFTAHDIAIKSAVTDAMKRAARHFGERFGNALYRPGATLATAPLNNKTALQRVEWSHGLDFGNQSELRDRKENGLPFPPHPGSHQAVSETAAKQARKPTVYTKIPNQPTHQRQHQDMNTKNKQSFDLPSNRLSLDCQTTPQRNRHESGPITGFVPASVVHVAVTPQILHQDTLVPTPSPPPEHAPPLRLSPPGVKRKTESVMVFPTKTPKRPLLGPCNPYR